MKRRGFTIVELLTVVGIISVLVTIVITAAAGAIRQARTRRADAMCSALQTALTAYYAQEGKWPKVIEDYADRAKEGIHTFSASDTDKIFQEIVGKGFGKASGRRSTLVDASALFVADKGRLQNGGKGCSDNHGNRHKSNFCGNQHCIAGIDFSLAANRNSKHYINFSNMAFGYQGTVHGKFCRFWVTYNPRTDTVGVSK